MSAFEEELDCKGGPARRHSRFASVARLSLLIGAMVFVPGCFDAPPEYSVPERIPPAIVSARVDPPLTNLLVTASAKIIFTAPFRADDFGQRLKAPMVLDIAGRADPIAEAALTDSARPFNEQERTATYSWTWTGKTEPGCHTMTLIISDSDNISDFYVTTDPNQEARVTWLMWLQQSSTTFPPDCAQVLSGGVVQ